MLLYPLRESILDRSDCPGQYEIGPGRRHNGVPIESHRSGRRLGIPQWDRDQASIMLAWLGLTSWESREGVVCRCFWECTPGGAVAVGNRADAECGKRPTWLPVCSRGLRPHRESWHPNY